MDDENVRVYEVPSKRDGVKALRATVEPRERTVFEEGDGQAFACFIEEVRA